MLPRSFPPNKQTRILNEPFIRRKSTPHCNTADCGFGIKFRCCAWELFKWIACDAFKWNIFTFVSIPAEMRKQFFLFCFYLGVGVVYALLCWNANQNKQNKCARAPKFKYQQHWVWWHNHTDVYIKYTMNLSNVASARIYWYQMTIS